MRVLNKACKGLDSKLPDLLLDPAAVSAKVRDHVAACEGCRSELEELKATVALMDEWEAPEPSPYFITRLGARMREEREAAPAGWLSRLRARYTYGHHTHMRPLAAMALTVVLLIGGGAYLDLNNWPQPRQTANDAAVVHDLQTLENNAQVLDTLENLSTTDNGD
jgi:hypothetical protein